MKVTLNVLLVEELVEVELLEELDEELAEPGMHRTWPTKRV
jgi:hypothetical protein